MDPPWKLSTSQPSRGLAIHYDSLSDEYIERIPVAKLQKGYKLVDSIIWVKKTVNGKIAKGHGDYLQHAK